MFPTWRARRPIGAGGRRVAACARSSSSRGSTRSSRSAPGIRSSASSSRTWRGAGSAASPRSSAAARLTALCHVGANVVPSGEGCGVFADAAVRGRARMIIGEEAAVDELWARGRRRGCRRRATTGPASRSTSLDEPPAPGGTGLRAATLDDLELLVPACAAAHREEIGIDPLERDPDGFRWRTRSQIEQGRSWLWRDGDTILFKAEASAWTPSAVQLQQVWVDPEARRHGYARRALGDLCRLLLERVPTVCLFVRPENAPALRLYDAVGMRRVLDVSQPDLLSRRPVWTNRHGSARESARRALPASVEQEPHPRVGGRRWAGGRLSGHGSAAVTLRPWPRRRRRAGRRRARSYRGGMERAILVRHGESEFSVRQRVQRRPGGRGRRAHGRAAASRRARSGALLADDPIDLCATSEFARTRETADLALAGRDVPRLVVPELNDIRFGSYEGGPLEEYRVWARAAGPADACPGGGESRGDAARRFAAGYRIAARAAGATILVVVHALPIRYVLSALLEQDPTAIVEPVEECEPHRFSADAARARGGAARGAGPQRPSSPDVRRLALAARRALGRPLGAARARVARRPPLAPAEPARDPLAAPARPHARARSTATRDNSAGGSGGSCARASSASIREHELIPPGGEVTCLVSGGADSTCLWHVLRELGYRVSALHVAHGLRGAESDEDARFCREELGAEVVERARRRPHRGGAARPALRGRRRPAARDRPHGDRPGRDRALPARLQRPGRARDRGRARGRRRASAARRLGRGDRGVLPRTSGSRTASTRRTGTRSAA